MDLAGTPLASQLWRLQNLYTIRNKQGRLIPFIPNTQQLTFYTNRHTCNHIGKARQLGFSTFLKILALDAMLFPSADSICPPTPDGIKVGHIDATLPSAKKKLKMVRDAYDHLDNPDLHPGTWQLGRIIKQAIPARIGAEEINFANGSGIWIGTSLRGDTPQILDISELGKIAMFFPIKAEEIRSGALNTIAPGNVINIESTHEGGEAGLHYELLDIAMNNDPETLTPVDFRFHFFPWYQEPLYSIEAPGLTLRPKIAAYFQRLEKQHGLTFTPGQMIWYDRTEQKQRTAMKKEYPTVPGEMFESINQYAIYGEEMANLTSATPPRILDFAPEAAMPIFTFWDIGQSDFTSIWFIQPVGDRYFLVLDWYETNGKSPAEYAKKLRFWESDWHHPIAGHYLPHDAFAIRPGMETSFAGYLAEAAIENIHKVPRTPDVWLGIGYTRDVLPHCFFHKTNTDTPREVDGQKLPSGLACLRGYHREISITNRTLREMPAHNQFSHSADAFRTFAEARQLGMLTTGPTHRPVAKGGRHRARRR